MSNEQNNEQAIIQMNQACDYLDEHGLWHEFYCWNKTKTHNTSSEDSLIKFVQMKKQEETNK